MSHRLSLAPAKDGASSPATRQSEADGAGPDVNDVDVVVVGAGFAGLTTARRLRERGPSRARLCAR